MKKANGEFEEAVTTGLDEIKAELRRTNLRIDMADARLNLQSERQSLLNEQLVATDKKVDRVIAGLSALLDKVEKLH